MEPWLENVDANVKVPVMIICALHSFYYLITETQCYLLPFSYKINSSF